MQKKLIYLIDNGHGIDTLGKHSPDMRLREYAYTREIARRIVTALKAQGKDARLLVPEEKDISLTERCRRVNAICQQYGAQNVVLVSVHNNAAGNGDWYTARGWLVLVDDAASAKAKRLADLLFDEVTARGLKTRQAVASRKWYLYRECVGGTKRLAILRGTQCPAVLTENFFQDNKEDVDWLLSETGKQAVTDIHVNALLKYENA